MSQATLESVESACTQQGQAVAYYVFGSDDPSSSSCSPLCRVAQLQSVLTCGIPLMLYRHKYLQGKCSDQHASNCHCIGHAVVEGRKELISPGRQLTGTSYKAEFETRLGPRLPDPVENVSSGLSLSVQVGQIVTRVARPAQHIAVLASEAPNRMPQVLCFSLSQIVPPSSQRPH